MSDALCAVLMLHVWCCVGSDEEYTASGRPKRKRKNRTKKDKDYVFEGDDEFVDGDGKNFNPDSGELSCLLAPKLGPILAVPA